MKKNVLSMFCLLLFGSLLFAWEPWVNISSSADHSIMPNIAIGYDGSVHAVWFEYNPTTARADIFYRKYDKNGWRPKVNISNTAWLSRDPSVAVDKAGNVYITWIDTFNRPNQRFGLAFREISANGTMNDMRVLISDVGQDLHRPSIACDPDGNISIVTYRGLDAIFGIDRDYGTWTPHKIISRPESTFATESCHIAYGADGYFHGTWPEFQRGVNPHMTLHYSKRPVGGDWRKPKDVWFIHEAQAHPKIATNKEGDPYITWMEEKDEIRFEAYFTKWDSYFQQWTRPRSASKTTINALLPSVTVARNGTVYVAWGFGNYDQAMDAVYNYEIPGEDFQPNPIRFFSTPVNRANYTQLANGGPNDNIFFIFEQINKPNNMKDVFITSLKPIIVSLPIFAPVNFSGQQVSTIKINQHFKNFFNLLKWEDNPENAESDIVVAGYNLYRREAGQADEEASLLANLPAGTFEYVDYNIEKGKDYVYLISAVDEDGNESEKVSLTVTAR